MRRKIIPFLAGKVNENYVNPVKTRGLPLRIRTWLTFRAYQGRKYLYDCPETQLPVLKAFLFFTVCLVLISSADLRLR